MNPNFESDGPGLFGAGVDGPAAGVVRLGWACGERPSLILDVNRLRRPPACGCEDWGCRAVVAESSVGLSVLDVDASG